MAKYEMVYGDDEQVVRETFEDVRLEREDGWVVVFRGKEAGPPQPRKDGLSVALRAPG